MKRYLILLVVGLVGCSAAGANTPRGVPFKDGWTCVSETAPPDTLQCYGIMVYDPPVVTTSPAP